MSHSHTFKTIRSNDVSVAAAFRQVAEKFTVSSMTVTALGTGRLGPIAFGNEGANAPWKALLDQKSFLIQRAHLQITSSFKIEYLRGDAVENGSPYFDQITLTFDASNPAPSFEDVIATVAMLQKSLPSVDPKRAAERGGPEASKELIAVHSAMLERLEQANVDLMQRNEEFRARLEAQHTEKLTSLDTDYQKKVAGLQRQKEIDEFRIKEQEKELAKKLAEIDDRDNTHVRRDIRDKMLADVKARIETFGVSIPTQRKRVPVFAGILMLGIVLAFLLLISILELDRMTRVEQSGQGLTVYWLWFRITALSIALFGTILYFIRWESGWANQHAKSEFQLQQFHVDVNRANWVIESCLEWMKETEQPIPPELLQSMTKGLFSGLDEDLERVVNPSDALASALMGTASKLRLKFGDSEMEIDKPGKLAKKDIRVKGTDE